MDMEDGYHQHLGHIGGIPGGARIFGEGGVADLIVDDDMYRTVGAVASEL